MNVCVREYMRGKVFLTETGRPEQSRSGLPCYHPVHRAYKASGSCISPLPRCGRRRSVTVAALAAASIGALCNIQQSSAMAAAAVASAGITAETAAGERQQQQMAWGAAQQPEQHAQQGACRLSELEAYGIQALLMARTAAAAAPGHAHAALPQAAAAMALAPCPAVQQLTATDGMASDTWKPQQRGGRCQQQTGVLRRPQPAVAGGSAGDTPGSRVPHPHSDWHSSAERRAPGPGPSAADVLGSGNGSMSVCSSSGGEEDGRVRVRRASKAGGEPRTITLEALQQVWLSTRAGMCQDATCRRACPAPPHLPFSKRPRWCCTRAAPPLSPCVPRAPTPPCRPSAVRPTDRGGGRGAERGPHAPEAPLPPALWHHAVALPQAQLPAAAGGSLGGGAWGRGGARAARGAWGVVGQRGVRLLGVWRVPVRGVESEWHQLGSMAVSVLAPTLRSPLAGGRAAEQAGGCGGAQARLE